MTGFSLYPRETAKSGEKKKIDRKEIDKNRP